MKLNKEANFKYSLKYLALDVKLYNRGYFTRHRSLYADYTHRCVILGTILIKVLAGYDQ